MKLPDSPAEEPKNDPKSRLDKIFHSQADVSGFENTDQVPQPVKNKPAPIPQSPEQEAARVAPPAQDRQRAGGPVRSSGQGVLRRSGILSGRKPASHPVTRSQTPVRPRPSPADAAEPETEVRPQAVSGSEVPVRVTDKETAKRPVATGKGINPGLRMRAFEAAARETPSSGGSTANSLRPNLKLAWRAAVNVAAVPSLLVNAILLGVLLLMAFQIRNLKGAVDTILGGLYGSFVQMDNASIATTITVNTDVPLNFTLPVQQNTDVTLTRNVAIPGAFVALNGLNVPVNINLPAGTSLPIALNLDIPVQLTVPVTIQVPVNIPMNQTELHAPFTGLQDTIRPLYCVLDKNAQYPEGIFICK